MRESARSPACQDSVAWDRSCSDGSAVVAVVGVGVGVDVVVDVDVGDADDDGGDDGDDGDSGVDDGWEEEEELRSGEQRRMWRDGEQWFGAQWRDSAARGSG